MAGDENKLLLELTTEVVSAYVAKNPMQQQQLPEIIREVHTILQSLSGDTQPSVSTAKPAVPPAKSVTPDFLICLEDGRKLKMLKRYLRNRYGLSPDEYREKWGLAPDYPMVAPNYAAKRSEFAKKIGLGRKPGAKVG